MNIYQKMVTNIPKIKFRNIDPFQDYYDDGRGNHYSVAKLVDESRYLTPFDMPIAGMQLDQIIWDDCNIIALAFHCKRVNKADLTKPIILDWNGEIADGRHRLIKAIMLGKETIKAVRITWNITPCRTGQ